MRRLGVFALALIAAACNPKGGPGITGDAPAATAPPSAASAASASGVSVDADEGGAEPAPAAARVQIVTASPDSDAISLIRTERLKAKADGRVLVVYVGATWCEPCRRFKEELRSGRLDARLAKLTLLAFDADTDLDRLGSAGYSFKFVPFVALPGADGRPADTQEATGKGGQAWRELLGKLDAWQQPTP